jgi:hypothetical protein
MRGAWLNYWNWPFEGPGLTLKQGALPEPAGWLLARYSSLTVLSVLSRTEPGVPTWSANLDSDRHTAAGLLDSADLECRG